MSLEPILENPFQYFAQPYKPAIPREKTLHPCLFLRKEFIAKGQIKRARIYATSHGIYTLEVNGHSTEDREFAPEFTSYEKYLAYQTYDITDRIHEGKNVVGAILADGWYAGRLGMFGDSYQFGDHLALLLQLLIEYADGTTETIGSDSSFRSSTGPYLYSDLFIGEKYDARKEIPGWSAPGFDDGGWAPVLEKAFGFDSLVAQYGAPVRRVASIPVKEILLTPKGDYVVDLGQNIAGRMRMRVQGPPGTTVTLEHSEVLDENGNFIHNIMGRNKDQIDVYVLKGTGVEIYEPKFTFHGFRYVKLSGFPGIPDIRDFTGIVISSDLGPSGYFSCSDGRINRLQENIQWSQRSNMLSIPTDCPQRERTGWTGDLQVFLPTGCFNMDLDAFITRWLRNARLDQKQDGQIPFIVPDIKSNQNFIPRYGISSAGWGDACIIVPWTLYRLYGDQRILEENYDMMLKWLHYVQHEAENNNPDDIGENQTPEERERRKYLWNTGKHFGDWLIPSLSTSDGGIDMAKSAQLTRELVPTCFYAYSAELLAKISYILGKSEEARALSFLNAKIRKAFAAEYLRKDGRFRAHFQGIYVLALKMKMVPDTMREKVFSQLVSLIQNNRNCLDTGFLSVPFLLDVLCDNGRQDIAYDLLFQTKCPSWLYEVENGATTIWEAWQAIRPNHKITNVSYNHYAFGCVGDWMYRNIAGISPDKPGYSHFQISPRLDSRITYCKASYQSIYGRIAVDWSMQENTLYISVSVPVNTTATIHMSPLHLKNGIENSLSTLKGTTPLSVKQSSNDLQLEIGSGVYSFRFLYA